MSIFKRWQSLSRSERIDFVLVLAYLVCFALGQLTRQSAFGLVWYASDLVIVVWFVLHLVDVISYLRSVLSWMKNHPLSWLILGWVIVSICIGVAATGQIRPLFILLRLLSYAVFAGSVALVFVQRRSLLRLALLGTGLMIAWLGLLQYVLIPDLRFLMALGWDDHYFRLVSTLFDPNFTGMMLVLTSLIVISLANRFPFWLNLTLLVFLNSLIALTYSRSTYLTYIFAMMLVVAIPDVVSFKRLHEKLLIALLLTGLFVATLLLAPKPGGEGVKLLRTASVEARATSSTSYVASMTVWTSLMGNGLFVQPASVVTSPTSSPLPTPNETSVFFATAAESTPENHAFAPDNLLITLLSGLGIFGTIAVLALLLILIHDVAKSEIIAAIALGAVLVHAQFNNTLFEPFIFQFLLLFISAPLSALSKEYRAFRSAKVPADNRLPKRRKSVKNSRRSLSAGN